MSKMKPIEPIADDRMEIIRCAMHLRGDYRSRGVNLTPREVLSLIERIKRAEAPEEGPDWQLDAFDATVRLAADRGMPNIGIGLSIDHLRDMRSRITPDFSRGKLGRWLGWAQCAVVATEVATLDDMKEINRAASQAYEASVAA
jgi:hypothetical protein